MLDNIKIDWLIACDDRAGIYRAGVYHAGKYRKMYY
jgi:hypothetical protein